MCRVENVGQTSRLPFSKQRADGDVCPTFFLALLLLVSTAKAEVQFEKDVVYGKGGDEELKLDLAQPEKSDTPAPCIVVIHGGAWRGGNKADLDQLARDFAQRHGLHLVLKGHRTIYASPSGQVFVNSTGNPGMASGGSGDVLTGILAGLLGQAICRLRSVETPATAGQNACSESSQFKILEESLALGVYLHGLAGDLATEIQGEQSLVASDIMTHLPAAFLKLEALSRAGR